MKPFLDKWDILGITLLIGSLVFLNYFNFIPLYKTFPFLSFLPHQTQKESIPTPTSVSPPVWQRGTQAIREGKIPQPKRILEVNLNYNETASPNLKIISINIKNGYSPKYPYQDKGYELQLFDKQNKLVSSLTFSIPNKIAGIPPPLESEQRILNPDDLILKKVDFTLTIPFVETAKRLLILDPQGKVIATEDLANVPIIDNKPNFDYIPGANVPEKHGNLLNFFPQALASASDGKLYITFIGDGYKNMKQFHENVDRFTNTLLTYEPFKTRASQIVFNRVDNTVDLDCKKFKKSVTLYCNYLLVQQQVNNAGVLYDKIFIIFNSKEIGGSGSNLGGLMAVGTNVKKVGEHGFVHELGHILGGLHDEYVNDLYFGEADNTVDKNCYTGKPTTEVWPGIPMSDYREGCQRKDWYRSSEHSIMQNLSYHYFNTISQQILNEELDFYAVPFTGPGKKPIPLATPPPGHNKDVVCTESSKTTLETYPIGSTIIFFTGGGETKDPRIQIVGYQWDLDGDGIWDTEVTNASVQHKYTVPGEYSPQFRIRGTNDTWSKTCSFGSIISILAPSAPPTPTPTLPPSETPTAIPTYFEVDSATLPTPLPTSFQGIDIPPTPIPDYVELPGYFAATPTVVPTSAPTLYPEAPTSPPLQKREIKSIDIDEKKVDISNPNIPVDLNLLGKEAGKNKYLIILTITYSDTSTKRVALLFNYTLPTPTPTPRTSIPSYATCVNQCNRFTTDEQKEACFQVCEDTKYALCVDRCERFPKEYRQACRQICDELLTPTPLPPAPTSTPTPTPVGCNCNIDEKAWISYGACGYAECASNEMPQYRTCDTTLSCKVETRCFPDARCPISTPTPIPGSCAAYKDNLLACVDDKGKRCKWTGSLCVDK